MPFYDRFFLGGPDDLRGFEYRTVGPKDSTAEPVGGKTYGMFTAEYSMDVVKPVRFAIFYDVGFVNSDAYDFNPANYNDDFGFGLRLIVAGAPLSLDFGIPADGRQAQPQGQPVQLLVRNPLLNSKTHPFKPHMNRSLKSIITAVAFGAGALGLSAQPAVKIVTADMNTLLEKYYKTDEQMAKIRAEEQKSQTELERMQKELNQVVEQYKEALDQSKSTLLTPEAKTKAEADVAQKGDDIRRRQSEGQTFMANAQRSLQQRISNVRIASARRDRQEGDRDRQDQGRHARRGQVRPDVPRDPGGHLFGSGIRHHRRGPRRDQQGPPGDARPPPRRPSTPAEAGARPTPPR